MSERSPTARSFETPCQHRALVVDDNLIYRTLVVSLLERRGFAVDSAEDARAALGCLQHDSFDLLLIDLHMPGMPGNELCRVIRRDLGLRDVPIVAYTADGLAASQLAEAGSGFDDVLLKPLDASNLDRLLARHFRDELPQ